MDREFFMPVPDDPVRGWTGLSTSVDTGEDPMLYRLPEINHQPLFRRTLIDAGGAATPLRFSDFC